MGSAGLRHVVFVCDNREVQLQVTWNVRTAVWVGVATIRSASLCNVVSGWNWQVGKQGT